MRGLVLGGGGAKGAFQVGVLKHLMGDLGLDYDIVCGVSVGALNASAFSQVPKGNPKGIAEWLEHFWLEKVEEKAIYKRWFPFGRLHALWLRSVYDSSPLAKLVTSNIDVGKVAKCGRQIAVGACCLDSGEYRFGRETDPEFVKWVLASSSFPIFFRPIDIEGKLWSDGGIKNVTPLGQAIAMGATEIDVIMCSNTDDLPWDSNSKSAVPDVLLRTVSLMSDQIVLSDLKVVGLKNSIAELDGKYDNVKIRVVMPKEELTDDSLRFDKVDILRMMAVGYADAHDITVWR